MSASIDQLAIDTIRALSIDAVQQANSGHPGAPLGLAPLGWLVFSRLRKHDPADPDWADRDRFVLSCGHASMLQYALLHLSGYDLPMAEIERFRQWGSQTPGHPEYGHTPGVETTTGPLGQGFATAVGMAMAERHLAARYNTETRTVYNHTTWCIASDGDLMEGVSAEAASLAGHLGLGKLIVFWDDNQITIDGATDIAWSEDVIARFRAAGWHTSEVDHGSSPEALPALEAAAVRAKADPRPSLIRVRTVIGEPSPGKRGSSKSHGSPLGVDEVAATKQAMGWSHDPFTVPEAVAAETARIREAGASARASWQAEIDAWRQEDPLGVKAFEAELAGELPAGWDSELPEFPASAGALATRKASGKVLNTLAARLPGLVGGSADLAGSNCSWQDGLAEFQTAGPGEVPRNVHWGIREHAMAAAVNGMALHGGVIPYAATFLIFSDYMRPAIRLACLMGVKARYLFTHDSIGLGEDGPTHQPVEHLAALRAIPQMTVLRPCDAAETVACWRELLLADGPAALVLTRQNLPCLDREALAPASEAARGGYVLADAEGELKAILIATGSEVELALAARETLQAEGIGTRVVSMPSVELFARQPADYRASVLPAAATARTVIEAGVRMGWAQYVGPDGGFVTLDRFGASAPYQDLYRELGITADAAVAETKRQLS